MFDGKFILHYVLFASGPHYCSNRWKIKWIRDNSCGLHQLTCEEKKRDQILDINSFFPPMSKDLHAHNRLHNQLHAQNNMYFVVFFVYIINYVWFSFFPFFYYNNNNILKATKKLLITNKIISLSFLIFFHFILFHALTFYHLV